AATRAGPREVVPKRLGNIGRLEGYGGYARAYGRFDHKGQRSPAASVPFVVEVWARKADRRKIDLCVNRTPVSASVHVWREGRQSQYMLSGCGLNVDFTVTRAAEFELIVNVQSPFVPLTTDGKQP